MFKQGMFQTSGEMTEEQIKNRKAILNAVMKDKGNMKYAAGSAANAIARILAGVQMQSINTDGSSPGEMPAYQDGTMFHPGGRALVGERGPEVVNLPRGAQVLPFDDPALVRAFQNLSPQEQSSVLGKIEQGATPDQAFQPDGYSPYEMLGNDSDPDMGNSLGQIDPYGAPPNIVGPRGYNRDGSPVFPESMQPTRQMPRGETAPDRLSPMSYAPQTGNMIDPEMGNSLGQIDPYGAAPNIVGPRGYNRDGSPVFPEQMQATPRVQDGEASPRLGMSAVDLGLSDKVGGNYGATYYNENGMPTSGPTGPLSGAPKPWQRRLNTIQSNLDFPDDATPEELNGMRREQRQIMDRYQPVSGGAGDAEVPGQQGEDRLSPITPSGVGEESGINNVAYAYQTLMRELGHYRGLLTNGQNEKGNLPLKPGPVRDEIRTARRNIQMQMKELYNLGVLNGPDLELMDQIFMDPLSLGNKALDVVGIADTESRALANANNVERMMKNLAEPRIRAMGLTLDDLREGQRGPTHRFNPETGELEAIQ